MSGDFGENSDRWLLIIKPCSQDAGNYMADAQEKFQGDSLLPIDVAKNAYVLQFNSMNRSKLAWTVGLAAGANVEALAAINILLGTCYEPYEALFDVSFHEASGVVLFTTRTKHEVVHETANGEHVVVPLGQSRAVYLRSGNFFVIKAGQLSLRYDISFDLEGWNTMNLQALKRSLFNPLHWPLIEKHQRFPPKLTSIKAGDILLGLPDFGRPPITQYLGVKIWGGEPVVVKEVVTYNEKQRKTLLLKADLSELLQDITSVTAMKDLFCQHYNFQCTSSMDKFYCLYENGLGTFNDLRAHLLGPYKDNLVQLLQNVYSGLCRLRDHGILHRDIRLENMIVLSMDPPRAALRLNLDTCHLASDIGIAYFDKNTVGAAVHAQAPEVAHGVYTHESDTWSFAYSVAQLLGYQPNTEEAIDQARVLELRAWLKLQRSGYSKEDSLLYLLLCILKEDPQERFDMTGAAYHPYWKKEFELEWKSVGRFDEQSSRDRIDRLQPRHEPEWWNDVHCSYNSSEKIPSLLASKQEAQVKKRKALADLQDERIAKKGKIAQIEKANQELKETNRKWWEVHREVEEMKKDLADVEKKFKHQDEKMFAAQKKLWAVQASGGPEHIAS